MITSQRRGGFSLVELLVALTVFGIVVTITVAFVARQNTVFQSSIDRVTTLRNLRYAVTTLTRDLETLGTNVPDGQPSLFYGDDDAVAFAADHSTNVASDPFAVFYDPHAPTGQVRAPSGSFSIPNSAVSWPDTAFEQSAGISSPAEVITFFFRQDSTTTRSDDWILYRKVNATSPELVARNLLQTGSEPFFSFERLADDSGGGNMLAPVADSLIPIHHSETVHLSAGDTARSALADSVRAVRVQLSSTNGLAGDEEIIVSLDRLIPLPNAGLGQLATCGSAPLLGASLNAVPGLSSNGQVAGLLSWSPATDETGGEADVVRYVIWRREAGATSWGDPFLAIPAGASSYTYEDETVESGTTYQYALAAQDCTPTLSSLAQSAAVIVP